LARNEPFNQGPEPFAFDFDFHFGRRVGMTVSAAVPFRRMVSIIPTGCFRMKMAKTVADGKRIKIFFHVGQTAAGLGRFLRQGCGSRWGELDVNGAKSRHGGGLAFLLLGLPWPYKVRSPERPRRVSDVIRNSPLDGAGGSGRRGVPPIRPVQTGEIPHSTPASTLFPRD
jgi:hypothetical protein